jgi:uncharacterized repeat protein (TIGR03803 family)
VKTEKSFNFQEIRMSFDFARPFRVASLLACALLALTLTGSAAYAQTYTVLVDFFGQLPSLLAVGPAAVQGRDGNYYGTSVTGGTSDLGTVFKITPSGVLTTLYSFDGTIGEVPYGGLALGTDGNFYGATNRGGPSGFGSVYKITPAGVINTLHAFTNTGDGTNPSSAPVLGNDGNFYGTTSGVDVTVTEADSTIYKITPTGVFTVVRTINPATEGSNAGSIILGADGNFYGGTASGGADGWGTLFRVTPTGVFTLMHTFSNLADGRQGATLAQAANGTFYGATYLGGANSVGVVFKMTPTGTFTKLHDLDGATDGVGVTGNMSVGTDGNFYNVAGSAGANNSGTLFKVTPAGVFSKVLDFGGANQGSTPGSGLIQATSGLFYGSTEFGGTGNASVFYKLNEHLAPFASLISFSGKESAGIGILGQGFTSGSVVAFGGVPATSIARLGTTFISATVPSGALTGTVTVTTGSTVLTSPKLFKVKPTITSFTPPGGSVGTSVTITGTGLIQATKVTFNGTSASFAVNSDAQITATVPPGATTGKIGVTTKGGSASSATNFTVN